MLYGGYLLEAIAIDRALYADGANFFVALLADSQGWPLADDGKHIRLMANMVNQLPAALALQSGITDIPLLRSLFGAGLFLMPPFVYLLCLWLAQRATDYRLTLPALAGMVSCAMPSEMFILNQALLALPLCWLLLHYLLLDLRLQWRDYLLMTFTTLLLFRSHESMALWGGGLAGAAVLAGWQRGWPSHRVMIAIVGLAQAAFVFYWQASHPVAAQTDAFLQLLKLADPAELWQGNTRLSVLFVGLLLAAGLWQFNSAKGGWPARTAVLLFSILAIFLLHSSLALWRQPELADPSREYSYRFLITFGGSLWLVMGVLWQLYGPRPQTMLLRKLWLALFIGLAAASIWQLANNRYWQQFSEAVQTVQTTSDSPLLYPQQVATRLAATGQSAAYRYRWNWAWPVLGMSIQADGRVQKLFRPETHTEAFDPPRRIPFIPMHGGDLPGPRLGLFNLDSWQTNAGSMQ